MRINKERKKDIWRALLVIALIGDAFYFGVIVGLTNGHPGQYSLYQILWLISRMLD